MCGHPPASNIQRATIGETLLLVPPVLLVSVIPVSVAGVREGAMVVALGFVGVAPAAVFAISVLFGLTFTAASREQAAALDNAPAGRA